MEKHTTAVPKQHLKHAPWSAQIWQHCLPTNVAGIVRIIYCWLLVFVIYSVFQKNRWKNMAIPLEYVHAPKKKWCVMMCVFFHFLGGLLNAVSQKRTNKNTTNSWVGCKFFHGGQKFWSSRVVQLLAFSWFSQVPIATAIYDWFGIPKFYHVFFRNMVCCKLKPNL